MTGLLRAEWTKLRSVRSTAWSLVATVIATTGFMLLATGLYDHQYATLDPDEQAHLHADTIGLILQPGAAYGQIAVCVLAVMAVTGEYASGTIRASLLAVPRRLPWLAAKGAVLAAGAAVVGVLLGVVAFLAGRAMLADRVTLSPSDPGVARAVLGVGLYLGTIGLFAMAVAALVRHTAGAITAVVIVVLVLGGLAALLPGRAGRWVPAFLPADAGERVLGSGRWADDVLAPWQGYGVLCAWTALLLALAAWRLVRRDA